MITLRRVNFPHTPVILTSDEVTELRSLLTRWSANGGPTQTREDDDANEHLVDDDDGGR
jgi:hypothetical protein